VLELHCYVTVDDMVMAIVTLAALYGAVEHLYSPWAIHNVPYDVVGADLVM
jgi:hypothetical protein